MTLRIAKRPQGRPTSPDYSSLKIHWLIEPIRLEQQEALASMKEESVTDRLYGIAAPQVLSDEHLEESYYQQ